MSHVFLRKWNHHDKCSLYLLSPPGGKYFLCPFCKGGGNANWTSHAWAFTACGGSTDQWGNKPRPTRLQKEYLQRKGAFAFSPNSPKVDGVHESALHSDLRMASSGESLKNFIRPLHLQFLLLLPRVVQVMMALMTASQNPQASVILAGHSRSICFLPGLRTFLPATTKPFGKVFCKPGPKHCGALVCLFWLEFLFPSIPHCDWFRKVALSSVACFLKRLCGWWPHFFDAVCMISLYQWATVALLLRNMLRDGFRKDQ